MNDINLSKYQPQQSLYGKETFEKLSKIKVFIYGMRGVK
jgi:tRNA A37 threonylcarbamoyladenosine dehydratase